MLYIKGIDKIKYYALETGHYVDSMETVIMYNTQTYEQKDYYVIKIKKDSVITPINLNRLYNVGKRGYELKLNGRVLWLSIKDIKDMKQFIEYCSMIVMADNYSKSVV